MPLKVDRMLQAPGTPGARYTFQQFLGQKRDIVSLLLLLLCTVSSHCCTPLPFSRASMAPSTRLEVLDDDDDDRGRRRLVVLFLLS